MTLQNLNQEIKHAANMADSWFDSAARWAARALDASDSYGAMHNHGRARNALGHYHFHKNRVERLTAFRAAKFGL